MVVYNFNQPKYVCLTLWWLISYLPLQLSNNDRLSPPLQAEKGHIKSVIMQTKQQVMFPKVKDVFIRNQIQVR